MQVQEMIDRIREARNALREVKSSADSPQLVRCVQLADMNLHWALWSLGEIQEIAPELEWPDGDVPVQPSVAAHSA